VLRLLWSVDSIAMYVNMHEDTEVDSEDHDFGLNDGWKAQSGERIIGVTGGDSARSKVMSNWRNAIMVTDY
jgi:hypothetical protein